MELVIEFPGGARVDASFGRYTVHTDQPPPGGDATAPTPFATYLASIGTCAGIYVLGFCRQRGLATDGIRLVEQVQMDPSTGLVSDVRLDIHVPSSFPAKYRDALIRAAEQCAVKKSLAHPPRVTVETQVDG